MNQIFVITFFVLFCGFTTKGWTEKPKCPENITPNEDILLPDEDDCTKFFQCEIDGTLVENICPDGLYFNPETSRCDWPSNVECNSNESQCPSDLKPDEDVLVPNPKNCSTFYQCTSDGSAVLIYCPEGLQFNADTGRCDYPENVNCNENMHQKSQEDKINENENPSQNEETDSSENAFAVFPNIEPKCPKNMTPDENILLPDEDDCTKFFQCEIDGTLVENKCPDGLYFNPETSRCDWPSNVECNSNDPKCPSDLKPDEDALVPNPKNCSTFYQCTSDGSAVLINCPAGLQFNANTERCDYPENVNCNENIGHESQEDNDDEMNENENPSQNEKTNNSENAFAVCPHIECSKDSKDDYLLPGSKQNQYCKCANGVPFQMECPYGLVFNSVEQICNWPDYKN